MVYLQHWLLSATALTTLFRNCKQPSHLLPHTTEASWCQAEAQKCVCLDYSHRALGGGPSCNWQRCNCCTCWL
jgi:hypothetical protein